MSSSNVSALVKYLTIERPRLFISYNICISNNEMLIASDFIFESCRLFQAHIFTFLRIRNNYLLFVSRVPCYFLTCDGELSGEGPLGLHPSGEKGKIDEETGKRKRIKKGN
jgi:hypothetical protein